jgi:hypothetical protein
MGMWTRAELESAFERYQSEVQRATDSGDWEIFVQLFAEDATYVEHLFGNFSGRDEIRGWITKTMGTFPGNLMTGFPVSWYVVDEERGWIVCEIENWMPDPGDGGSYQATNVTILKYAGNNLFASEEDVYNPEHFKVMIEKWIAVAVQHGRMPSLAAD